MIIIEKLMVNVHLFVIIIITESKSSVPISFLKSIHIL